MNQGKATMDRLLLLSVQPEEASGRIPIMQNCPTCGNNLDFSTGDVHNSFTCQKCRSNLRVTLRCRILFLLACTAAAVFFRGITLVVSPKSNLKKTSGLAFAFEAGLTNLFRQTKLVRVSSPVGQLPVGDVVRAERATAKDRPKS